VKLIQAIERAATRLKTAGVSFGHGTLDAFDEAAWLALWQMKLPLDSLDDNDQRILTPSQVDAIDLLVDQRIATRKPAAYLTGEAWLQGVPFVVDERVIVPRSLIAEPLADGTLDAWLPPASRRVLDLCTGSGCLAVLAAITWPDVGIDACDISEPALEVARINLARHGLGSRIQVLLGDGLFACAGQRYDVILCNPPYVNAYAMSQLPPEYRAEPAIALDGGPDGMAFIRRLVAHAQAFMTPHGVLVLEIGNEWRNFNDAFDDLAVIWIETSAGEHNVALITREALVDFNVKRAGTLPSRA
jgi:ribosomal protein L3 glutamine methyltransferase